MPNINGKAQQARTYDAIVVGSGISGGWAAKELTEKGLKVLLLERGRTVEHIKDYTGMNNNPWDKKFRGAIHPDVRKRHPVQSKCYAFLEDNADFWVDDIDHPYDEEKPFNWLRGYHVGGRSLMWHRMSFRFE